MKLVNMDWLEDSLLSNGKILKPTEQYDWEIQAKKAQNQANAMIVRDQKVTKELKAFEKERIEFEKDTEQKGYNIYRDSTGFAYSINLLRPDILTNRMERHQMKVRDIQFSSESMHCDTQHLSAFYVSSTTQKSVSCHFHRFLPPHPLSREPCVPNLRHKQLSYAKNPNLRVSIADP